MKTTTRDTATAIDLFRELERARVRLLRAEDALNEHLATATDLDLTTYVEATDRITDALEEVLSMDHLAPSTRNQRVSQVLSTVAKDV